MLRVETQQLDGSLLCRLEGRFTGEGAEQARTLVTRCDSGLRLVVDLTEMMFVDGIGEQVLSFAKKLGAQFIAETAYSRDVCERLWPSSDGEAENELRAVRALKRKRASSG